MVAMTLFMPPGSVCKVATLQGIWSVTKTWASSIGDNKMTTFKIELDIPELANPHALDASRTRMIDEEKLEGAIMDWLASVRFDFRANWRSCFKGKNGPESLAWALQMDEALDETINSVVVTQISENNSNSTE